MSRLISIGLTKQLKISNKAKPPPFFGHKMKKIREAQESVWINKTLAKVCLDHDNDNGCVYCMICDVKQDLLKDPLQSVG